MIAAALVSAQFWLKRLLEREETRRHRFEFLRLQEGDCKEKLVPGHQCRDKRDHQHTRPGERHDDRVSTWSSPAPSTRAASSSSRGKDSR